jgi:PAS domain S-box-containing protein
MERQFTILVIEDTDTLLRLYSQLLSQAGYPVLAARSGTEGLEVVRRAKPDIVLLDRVLPDIDGNDVCIAIKRDHLTASTYVIMLSALKTSEDDRVSGLEAGADDYLAKPVSERELLARVQVATRLQSALKALQLSEWKYRTLAENTPDFVARFSNELHYLYANPVVERLSGLSSGQILNRYYCETSLFTSQSEFWRETLRTVVTKGCQIRVVAAMDTVHGIRNIDMLLAPEFDTNLQVDSILAVGRDVTEQVRAEQEIARLATVVEQAIESVLITDTTGIIVYANAAYARMSGYYALTLEGVPLLEHLTQIGADPVIQGFTSAARDHIHWTGISSYQRRDGAMHEMEASVFPVSDRSGIVINHVLVLRDISERRRSEREREVILTVATALRRAPRRSDMLPVILDQLLVLLDVVGASVVTIDSHSKEVAIELTRGTQSAPAGSRQAVEYTLTPEIVRNGRPYVDNHFQPNLGPNLDPVRPHLQSPTWAIAAVPLVAQNFGLGALWITSRRPISDDVLRILAAIGDMTATALFRADLYEQSEQYAAELELRVAERTAELAAANEQLRELDRLKSQFVSTVTHELRAPIGNLKLYMSLLQMGHATKRGQYEAMLKESVERLGLLVQDILSLSRLEIAHHQPLDYEPTDLNAVIQQIVNVHQSQANAAGLRLSFSPDATMPLVHGDYNQLSQLITNLITNALNYTDQGFVKISTHGLDTGKQVSIVVEDSGIGIHADDLPHIFERFYRGVHPHITLIPGTGLGLAIVKEIVEIHRGNITIASSEGKGTQVKVWLPA